MQFFTLKFTMWRYHWKKSPNFYRNFHSVRLLANAVLYLSSDVYSSASDYLAAVSEHTLLLIALD